MDPFLQKFLTSTDEMIIEKVREFSEKYLTESEAKEIERTDGITPRIVDASRAVGLFGIRVPERYGGSGLDLFPSLLIHEVISSYSLSVGVYLDQTLFVEPVIKFGTEDQKERYLGEVARAGVTTTSAMTEPLAGSDILGISSKATRVEGGWKLNGVKTFITMGDQANCFVVFAKTSEGRGKDSLTAFLVERGTKGLQIGKSIEKIGQVGTHINEIFLEDLLIEDRNVLGKVGQGYEIAMYSYQYGRLTVAVQALGLAEGLMKKSVDFSLNRKAFDQQINRFQLIKDYIARMDVMIETAKSMIYRASTFEGTPLFSEYTSISKLYATEICTEVARLAVKIHGGMGVTRDMGLERALRDAVIQEIYEGTNEVQKLIISKDATDRYRGESSR
ncbi:MAG: acyl-CoA dehydrogenase family protein [Candidatus Thermoplasmatota archaeon]|jgi:alkylation response protein AidB-like acyl-CoA dehydrogenase|nr:acyl-CoA dehydrogenase family protein [Candidatus Thermoplasmatota archaeon]